MSLRSYALAARELGYVSSPAASRLAGGRTGTVAVVVLRDRGMDLLLYNLGHVEGRERYFSGEALRQRADAVLVRCLPLSPAELEAIGGARIPVALVGADVEDCPSVRIDDVAGGRTAVQHLVNLGHERIALISGTPGDPMGFTTQFERRQGYRETLAAARLPVDPSFAGRDWLGHPATALASIIVLSVWQGVGLQMIIIVAGLQEISPDLYEAAMIDNADPHEKMPNELPAPGTPWLCGLPAAPLPREDR